MCSFSGVGESTLVMAGTYVKELITRYMERFGTG